MDSEVILLKSGNLNVFGLEEINSDSELNDIMGGCSYTSGNGSGPCYCFATAGG